jgi:CheY-like chemotaxis protein
MIARQPRLRVLVVENEMLLRLVAEEIVLELGHDIVGSATSARGAIAEAERTRPDVVLMDIQLDGEGDGIDAALEIRDRLGVASLFVTGCVDLETRKRASVTGPLDYLQKPLTLANLRAALDRHPGVAVAKPLQSEPDHPQPPLVVGSADDLSPAPGDSALQTPDEPSKTSQ